MSFSTVLIDYMYNQFKNHRILNLGKLFLIPLIIVPKSNIEKTFEKVHGKQSLLGYY